MKTIIISFCVLFSFYSFSQDVLEYYHEISSYSEYSLDNDSSAFQPRKWKSDVLIYVKGIADSIAIAELNKVILELNEIIEPIEIKITNDESKANLIAFFGWCLDYDKFEPNAEPYTGGNHGLACIYPDNNNDLIKGSFYVDVVRCDWFPQEQSIILKKHLVREELTQSLGLMNDSMKYPTSIFYQGFEYPTEFSKLDIEIIKMHYN